MSHVMSWCVEGRHEKCHRKYQRFYIDPRTNKVVWLEDWAVCQCRKRGCECYIKPADREKPATKRKPRKRKS